MLKLEFKNAVVRDNGYIMEVNGKSLDDIISTALGTKVGDIRGYRSSIPEFRSNCCNVTIIIDPQPVTEFIEDDYCIYESVKEMEACKIGKFKQENEKTDPEE